MDYDLDTRASSTYSLYYHLILIMKYRHEVFTEELTEFFREVVTGFTDTYGVEIKNLEADPTTAISTSKSASTRRIRNEFMDDLLNDSSWTDTYCLSSTEHVSLDVLSDYAETQHVSGLV